MNARRKTGLRVLVVEDEFLLACSLEEDLLSFGFAVVGPFSGVAQAAQVASTEALDLAVLDINLRGEMVYPLAERLMERGIPVLFLTGYGLGVLPFKFRTAPVLAKPYELAALEGAIDRLLQNAGRPA
jgi:DNA-binding response OmpR family regulator